MNKKSKSTFCVLVMISLNRNGKFHSYAMHYWITIKKNMKTPIHPIYIIQKPAHWFFLEQQYYFNPFLSIVLILYQLKKKENHSFYNKDFLMFSGGYKTGILARRDLNIHTKIKVTEKKPQACFLFSELSCITIFFLCWK